MSATGMSSKKETSPSTEEDKTSQVGLSSINEAVSKKVDAGASKGRLAPMRRSRSFSQGDDAKSTVSTKSRLKRAASLRLGKKKSSKDNKTEPPPGGVLANSSAASGPDVIRKTSFKRIRGIFNGESRRARREARRKAKSGAPNTELSIDGRRSEISDDDVSTVNVNLDDRSVANSTVVSSKIPGVNASYLLRMVLLLMDVTSRRFELLQLEFDSAKALVSDVLSQIPVSVTEESLKGQVYEAIVTTDGRAMDAGKRLADFCKGNDVLVAIPKGLSGEEAHKLSKPILSNAKVLGMLKSSGVDISSFQTPKAPSTAETEDKKERRAVDWSSQQMSDGDLTKKPVQLGGSLVFAGIVVAIAAVVAAFVHKYISTPLQPGKVLYSGVVLSKCGLQVFSECEPAYLKVQPGKVLFYKDDQIAWVIRGHACPDEDLKNMECFDGLEFKADSTLWLGGEPVTWIERHPERLTASEIDHLVPWPFTEQPMVKFREMEVKNEAPSLGDNNARKQNRKL